MIHDFRVVAKVGCPEDFHRRYAIGLKPVQGVRDLLRYARCSAGFQPTHDGATREYPAFTLSLPFDKRLKVLVSHDGELGPEGIFIYNRLRVGLLSPME
ncbi:hypothetical protein D3C78_1606710 [compost metagenome]